MSNQFKFKQFTIQNDLAAMKVGTDAVLLGAWANVLKAKTILDIGTGTGILSLMCAQRNHSALITAIDIEESAIAEAKINVDNSKWNNQISVLKTSLEEFKSQSSFDYIICNPPFFKFTNQSPKIDRQNAREQKSLGLKELAFSANRLLNNNGKIGLVYLFDKYDDVIKIFEEHQLYLGRELRIQPTPNKPFKRILAEFSKEKKEVKTENLVIEDKGRHGYSDQYKELTKDFYLNF